MLQRKNYIVDNKNCIRRYSFNLRHSFVVRNHKWFRRIYVSFLTYKAYIFFGVFINKLFELY